ncbi:MAG TPA: nucleotide exchange factor GrpE [Bacteroidales bacterium]|nr:nucleotide exchange factor GrpE [Bacteroidales bacterium]
MATRKKDNEEKNQSGTVTKGADSKQDNKEKTDVKAEGEKPSESEEPEEMSDAPAKEKKDRISEEPDKERKTEPTAEEKLSEIQDKYIRLSAEFDNYRKRTLKEKMDLIKYAGESILINLLPVMDDFDRAMKVMESATDCKSMKEGIDLIYNKFQDFFKQNGIREIEATNLDFDIDLHEAVTKIPAPEKKLKGKVVDVIQKGYFLNEKVMRYSKVVIGE